MKLRQLAAFIRVCQIGSITRAASELNIAQPALGLQMRNLEAEFGAELIIRGPRGVRPTAAGELVLAWAEEVLQSRDAVRHKVREIAARVPDSLKLGITPSVAGLVSDTLTDWAHAEGGAISLTLIKAFSNNISQLVEMKQLDLGLTCSARPRPALESVPLLMERLYYMGVSDGNAGPIALEDVLKGTIALPSGRDSVRRAVDDGAQSLGLPLQNTMEINSLETAKDLAVAGMAGCILPLGSAPDAAGLGLSLRPIVTPSLTRAIYLVRRHDHIVTDTEHRLVEVLTAALLSLRGECEICPYELPLAHPPAEAPAQTADTR